MAKSDYRQTVGDTDTGTTKERVDAAKRKINDRNWSDPPEAFTRWWNPSRLVDGEGSMGGHYAARRAYYCDQRLEMMWHGITAKTAWNTRSYREEWQRAEPIDPRGNILMPHPDTKKLAAIMATRPGSRA